MDGSVCRRRKLDGITSAPTPQQNSNYFCYHFAKGQCAYGESCTFMHLIPTARLFGRVAAPSHSLPHLRRETSAGASRRPAALLPAPRSCDDFACSLSDRPMLTAPILALPLLPGRRIA